MTTNTIYHDRLFNTILFQAVWFALIISADSIYFWLGPTCAVIVLSLRLPHMRQARLLLPLAGIAVIGFSFDLVAHASGIITLVKNPLSFSWLLILWLFFVAMFHQVFAWLTHFNLIIVFSIGAIGGPLAYYSASLFGAVIINNLTLFIVLYSVFWGIGFVVATIIMVARGLNRAKITTG